MVRIIEVLIGRIILIILVRVAFEVSYLLLGLEGDEAHGLVHDMGLRCDYFEEMIGFYFDTFLPVDINTGIIIHLLKGSSAINIVSLIDVNGIRICLILGKSIDFSTSGLVWYIVCSIISWKILIISFCEIS